MKTKVYVLVEVGFNYQLEILNKEVFANEEQAVERMKKHYDGLVQTYTHYLEVGYVFTFKGCNRLDYTIDIQTKDRLIHHRGEIQELEVQE